MGWIGRMHAMHRSNNECMDGCLFASLSVFREVKKDQKGMKIYSSNSLSMCMCGHMIHGCSTYQYALLTNLLGVNDPFLRPYF